MLIVVDANRLYSSLLSKGKTFKVFLRNAISHKFEFIAPDFIFFEIGKHTDDIVLRSKLSREELAEVFSFIKEQVKTLPFKEFNSYAAEAESLAPHEKDTQYFALALAAKSPIWSQEKSFLKQSKIKILDTDRLLKELE